MQLQRISVKFYIAGDGLADITKVVPVFHDWIKNSSVPGMLIDVHDYKHVPGGPGILLVGHEGDYALDTADGDFGITYTHKRKRETDGDVASVLRGTLSNALAASIALADSIEGVTFDATRVRVSISDRRLAPNTDETDTTVGSTIATVVSEMFGSTIVGTRVDTGAGGPYCQDYNGADVTDLATLASNLSATSAS